MNRCATTMIIALLLAQPGAAEIYIPPDNVKDPARRTKPDSSDASLPYIYLEPHDFCYDVNRPLPVTLSVVNRSGRAMTIDWRAIIDSLVLEANGPGRVTPVGRRPAPDSVGLAGNSLAQLTINLHDLFNVEGASVYRLTYVRPLEDGRIHIAAPVQLVIEDDAAVDKLAAAIPEGPARDALVALLKDNPCFAVGSGAKTFGWDELSWHNQPKMLQGQWNEALAGARKDWVPRLEQLTEKAERPAREQASEVLVNRLLVLSDNFRAKPGTSEFERLNLALQHLSLETQERLYLKLVRSHSRYVVSWSMNRLMSLRSKSALDEFFRIGDGPDPELAEEAIGSLSSLNHDSRIVQYLRRKMTADDPAVALHAAIVSCYSGDASGGAMVVRCMKSDDPKVRLNAIAQVVDESHFRPHRDTIVRLLLEELKKPTSEAHLLRALESLGSYPSDEVLKAVLPFVQDKSEVVASRAKATVGEIMRTKNR